VRGRAAPSSKQANFGQSVFTIGICIRLRARAQNFGGEDFRQTSGEEREMAKRIEYINPKKACPPQGLYSHVTRVSAGTLYFVAGQLAVDGKGKVAGKHDFARQFRQVFDNLEAVLKGIGTDFKDVVKFTTYLVHSQDIEKFMEQRAAYFPKIFGKQPYPPNTLLIVDRLVKEEFLLEVEAVVAGRD
jgi:enamine deaminase RidA (YjgF/YER057c/UK114 family)